MERGDEISTADSLDEEIVDEEDNILPPHLSEEFFEEITQKFSNVTKYLHGLGNMEYAAEVQKLYSLCQRLKKENNAKADEIANMNVEIDDAKRRINLSLTISKVDHETISRLRVETENAWKQTDAAHAREQLAQEQLYILREKLDKIDLDSAKIEGRKEGDEELISSLAPHKDSILKERDRLAAEVEELNRRLQIQRLYTDEIERRRAEIEEKNKELYKFLDDVSGEAHKEKRNIDNLKEQLSSAKTDNAALVEEIGELKKQSETLVTNNVQQNMQILALKTNLERMTNQYTSVVSKLTKNQSDAEHLSGIKEKLQTELNHKTNLLKFRDEENQKLKLELTKIEKSRESYIRKLQVVEAAKNTVEADLMKVRNETTMKSKQETVNTKAAETLEKRYQLAIRERNSLQSEIPRLHRRIAEEEESVQMAHNEIRALKEEIKQKNKAEQKQKAIISRIEVERDRNAEETQILDEKIVSLNEDIHLKDQYIVELKESTNDLNTNLVKMQGLFETARAERNTFQRNLQGCMEEKDRLKSLLTVAYRKLEQSKDTISAKEIELIRTQKNIEKLEKNFQKLRIEFKNLEVILQNTRSELKEKRLENERLYKSLSDDEIRLAKIRKQYDSTIYEKDLIGTQMIRRNDEIVDLKEKLEILESALNRGEKQYAERIEDIRLLKIEIKNLRSQRNVLTRGLTNTADMRHEVLQLHRILNQERIKSKALEEEMVTPMNVHRWRALGGKDPERLALIKKIQCLQKRILAQTVSSTEREHDLHEVHKLYSALKEFMLKLPSYKVKERLLETQHALSVRDKKLKALAAELTAKTMEEKTKECVVNELRSNLETTKKELIREKKTKQKLLKDREIVRQIHSYSAPPTASCVRTMGAGFKMTFNT